MNDFLAGTDTTNITSHIYNDVNVEKGILHFAKSIDACRFQSDRNNFPIEILICFKHCSWLLLCDFYFCQDQLSFFFVIIAYSSSVFLAKLLAPTSSSSLRGRKPQSTPAKSTFAL